jgi:DNA-binding Lrp family transcriptional regulator
MTRRPDEVDDALIALLKVDAREPVAALARRLGLSRSAVQERLARLERDGIIAGYTLRLNAAPARDRLQAIVRFTMNPKFTPQVVERIRHIPEAEACWSVSGAFDLVVFVSADSAVRLNQVLQSFGEIEGVERTTSSIVLVTEFDHR